MGQMTPAEQARLRAEGRPQPVGRGQTPGPNVPLNTPRNQPPPKQPAVPAFGGGVTGSPNTPVTNAFSGVANAASNIAGAFTPPATTPAPGPTPISFNGGSYNPTTAPYGYDQSAPGTQEQFWNNNQALWFQSPQLDWIDSQQGQFQDPWYGENWNQNNMGQMSQPGAGQQFWNGVQGQFNSMAPSNSQTAFDMTKGMLPGSIQPKFDAYYDRMKDKVMGDVNSQSAARGAYGSNTALNNTIGAGLDVEANRAKAGTDFALADSANQREWQNTLGTQGRYADLSKTDMLKLGGDLAFKAEDADFNRDKFNSETAFGIDEHRRNRLDSGISSALSSHQEHAKELNDAFAAAGKAQNAREGRVGGLYDDVSGFTEDVQGFFSENYDKLMSADEATFESMMNTMMGEKADQRGWDTQQQERIMRDAKQVWDMMKGSQAQGAGG